MPILTVTGGATIREGEKAIFTVSLTSALTQDVWFRASTITSAGASSADGDYDAILDKLYFIPAGSKKINISVQTYNAGTQNEGLEGVGLWVDEVYHYDVSIGGNGKGYVTILDTIPPIELSVRNTSGNEGNKIGFIVQAENPVLYDTTVYLQVQGTTTAGIASGNWWVAGLIKSGQTSTTVNISTIDDGQSGNRRIDVKLFSYYEEVVMLDDTAYGTVYNTTLNQLPILDIFADSDVNEGQETTSYARLSFAVNYDVTFQVSTWLGEASGDANRNPDSPDYEYLLNKTFIIYAGTLTSPIPVRTLRNNDPTDWAQEVFSIRVEPGSVSGAILGQARADILIKDVAIATSPEPDLSAFQHLIDTLVIYEGVSGTAAIITESNTLSTIAQSLEVRGLLADGVWEATGLGAIGGDEGYFLSLNWWPSVLAFVAKSAYRAATGQEMFDEISYGEIINNSGAVAPKNMSYSSEQIAYEGNSILKPGDMVDGRLVIHQPWMALKDGSNDFVVSSSSQGRDGGNNFSHNGDISNSFDWSGVSKYAVVPVDSYVVASDDSKGIGNSNHGLGNFVTLKAVNKTGDGKDIYLTFAHLEQGTVNQLLKSSDINQVIKAGTLIGETGNTGGDYDVHLHMQAGTALGAYKDMQLTNATDDIPPVYMMGFRKEDVVALGELADEDPSRVFLVQDYGFPIGYNGGRIVENILPTINLSTFSDINTFIALDSEAIMVDRGGQDNIYAMFKVRQYEDVGLTQEVAVDWSSANLRFTTLKGNSGGNGVDYVGGENVRGSSFAEPIYFDASTGQVFVKLLNYEQNWAGKADKTMGLMIESASGLVVIQKGNTYATLASGSEPVGMGGDLITPSEVVNGDTDDDLFVAEAGDHTYLGKEGFDEIHYYGDGSNISNFTFIRLSDGSTQVESPTFGTDILTSVEGIYFGQSNLWKLVSDLILDETENGTIGDDVFTASMGNDTYNGGQGFDEISFFGPESLVSNFTFTQNPDSSVTVISPYGTDTLNSIEGVWFGASVEWHSVNSLVL